jgi:L-rhamnose-H+ transport protein
MPPVFSGQMSAIVHEPSGQVILAGVGVCLLAIAVSGLAGYSKEHEISSEDRAEAGERDYSFGKGLAVAIFAGIMSSCFAYGLAAGKPIAEIARTRLIADHRLDLWQNLPVLVVVLWGGFFTNFVWSAFLILRNRSFAQFAGEPGVNPMGASHASGDRVASAEGGSNDQSRWLTGRTLLVNYLFAALAGVIWYFQFFFYSMGQTKMGKYDFSSWTLHMVSIIIFATLWGMALREWRGTSRRTKALVGLGLFLLVGSSVIVGYGNYLKVH